MENNNESSKDEFVKVDLKDGTKNSKDFFTSFFQNPITLLKNISKCKNFKLFNVSLIILLIWLVITFIHSLFDYGNLYTGMTHPLVIIRDLTIPILSVGFLSLIIHCINPNKDDDYRLTNAVTSVIVCKIPIIFSSFLSLLAIVSTNFYFLLDPITDFCTAISIIFTFFAIKYLYKESEDAKSFKMFLIVEAVFYIVYLFLSFLDIYLI